MLMIAFALTIQAASPPPSSVQSEGGRRGACRQAEAEARQIGERRARLEVDVASLEDGLLRAEAGQISDPLAGGWREAAGSMTRLLISRTRQQIETEAGMLDTLERLRAAARCEGISRP